jgi:transcriptional regulator with XRE-family HTH domain
MSTDVTTTTVRDRIREIASDVGGPSALARRAELTPSTISQYLSDQEGRASEPGVTALVKLAKGAGVSLTWLATGELPKVSATVPEGYFNCLTFDLSATGNHIRGILDQFGQHPRKPKGRLIYRYDIVGVAPATLESYVVEKSGLEFPPEIVAGDIFLFTVPHGHEVVEPSNVQTWDFIEESGIYLVATGVELKLRKLRRQKESVQVISPSGKIEAILSGTPRDFIVFGLVIWRSGAIHKFV